MPRGPTITDIERGQIFALHKECISYRKIAKMLNSPLGAVKGVIRQGFKPKAPKKWKGNQKYGRLSRGQMVRTALQGRASARTIQSELKLPIGS